MASGFAKYSPVPLILILLCFSLKSTDCVELEVGGDTDWATPPPKNEHVYNDWASKNRFKVNDTLRFRYNKDAVLVVTEEEYENCRSSHPQFFSNSGDTLFTLDRPGLFYFVSGIYGHCRRGLKMIVKVLEPESPSQAANHHSSKSAAAAVAAITFAAPVLILLCIISSMLVGVLYT